jgi:hypothetical protein
MIDTIRTYSVQADILAARYEAIPATAVHAPMIEYIPRGSGLLALDVGAGSGRDSAWLASAAEPAGEMRAEAQRDARASAVSGTCLSQNCDPSQTGRHPNHEPAGGPVATRPTNVASSVGGNRSVRTQSRIGSAPMCGDSRPARQV